MSEFLEKYHIKKGLSTAIKVVKTAWDWTQERLWPVYSAAIVISIFQMIAISSEKQIIADHFYGDKEHKFESQRAELVTEGKKYYNEEVTLAVKEKVWQMPKWSFEKEYAERHGTI